MIVVCPGCGWNQEYGPKYAPRARSMPCPECGRRISLLTTSTADATNWAIWLTVGTVVLIFLAGLATCAGAVALKLVARQGL
jgi:hypothetical protein